MATTFTSLIDRWDTLSQFAKDVGVPYERAKQWRHRSSIPVKYWPRVIDGAVRGGIAGIDRDALYAASQAPQDRECNRAA